MAEDQQGPEAFKKKWTVLSLWQGTGNAQLARTRVSRLVATHCDPCKALSSANTWNMHSYHWGSHRVKLYSYCFTGFWDVAGEGQTHRHTHRDYLALPMLTFSKSYRLWKQKQRNSSHRCPSKCRIILAVTVYCTFWSFGLCQYPYWDNSGLKIQSDNMTIYLCLQRQCQSHRLHQSHSPDLSVSSALPPWWSPATSFSCCESLKTFMSMHADKN